MANNEATKRYEEEEEVKTNDEVEVLDDIDLENEEKVFDVDREEAEDEPVEAGVIQWKLIILEFD